MNKKGFTLVELLAVIVLIAIIGAIGTYGIMGVNRNIKEQLWAGKVDLIKTGAEQYGDENKNLLKGNCIIKEKDVSNCMEVTVGNLIEKGFVTTKEKDDTGKGIIKNDATNKVVNEEKVFIYLENDVVYSEF
ncbi:MAG: prepilin-type N-terminal cleavage/methylation domain-containing protein [Bacilli bacterium]